MAYVVVDVYRTPEDCWENPVHGVTKFESKDEALAYCKNSFKESLYEILENWSAISGLKDFEAYTPDELYNEFKALQEGKPSNLEYNAGNASYYDDDRLIDYRLEYDEDHCSIYHADSMMASLELHRIYEI